MSNTGTNTSPWVSIVLLNYNGFQDTIECLESLLKLEHRSFNIIVVDNQSSDNSLAHIQDWLSEKISLAALPTPVAFGKGQEYAHLSYTTEKDWMSGLGTPAFITTIQAGQNLGFASGNNVGITYALGHFSPEFVWLLNNDTVVATDSLSQLVARAQASADLGQKIGIWGAKLFYYDQPDTLQAIGGKLNLKTLSTSHIGEGLPDGPAFNTETVDQDYVVGASLFVSKAFLADVGLLNQAYFLYFEELDWATRGKEKGYGLGYVWQCRVYHKEGRAAGSSSNGSKKSALADYHGIRSKIIYFTSYYPQRRLQLYSLLLASSVLRLVRRDFGKAFQVLKLMVSPQKG
ncbi:glycosyltransferase family 2 protein [Rufibacter soli]|jgi:GT2 family glycosyltransferase